MSVSHLMAVHSWVGERGDWQVCQARVVGMRWLGGIAEMVGLLAHSFGQGWGCEVLAGWTKWGCGWHIRLARVGGMRW